MFGFKPRVLAFLGGHSENMDRVKSLCNLHYQTIHNYTTLLDPPSTYDVQSQTRLERSLLFADIVSTGNFKVDESDVS